MGDRTTEGRSGQIRQKAMGTLDAPFWNIVADELKDLQVTEAAYRAAALDLAAQRDALAKRFQSAVETLKDIAAMGRKAGSESARNRLRELGIDVPDYGSMT